MSCKILNIAFKLSKFIKNGRGPSKSAPLSDVLQLTINWNKILLTLWEKNDLCVAAMNFNIYVLTINNHYISYLLVSIYTYK